MKFPFLPHSNNKYLIKEKELEAKGFSKFDRRHIVIPIAKATLVVTNFV